MSTTIESHEDMGDVNLDSLAEELYNIQSFNKDVILDCYDMDDYDHTQLEIEIDFRQYKEGLPILKISSKGKTQKKKLVFDLARNQIVCGKKKKVNFSEIDEIRVGHKTNIFNTYKNKNASSVESHLEIGKNSFSILFSGNLRKSMDFICNSVEERRKIVSALYHIVQDAKSVNNEYNFVKREWDAIGKDTIDFSTLKKILARLNFTTSDSVLQNLMKFTDANSDSNLDFSEFSNLLKLLRSHPELKPVFYKFNGGTNETSIPINGMIQFFKQEQNEDWTIEQCRELIVKYHHEPLGAISFENFEDYLTGELNQAVDPLKYTSVYQDTNRPISHYYVNSSHNTYLSGHQLKGMSTSEMYTTTLRAGCKCVELDVWDGSDGDPIIFHGNTLTSQIKFSHVCETIKARGFETSPFPVILSLEVHCSIPQQIRMAQHMKEIFGEMLPAALPEGTKELPSLESLKYKVLLKGHISHGASSSSSLGSLTSSTSFESGNNNNTTTTTTTTTTPNEEDGDGAVDYSNDGEDDEEYETRSSSFSLHIGSSSSKKKPVKSKVASELGEIIYLVCQSFKSGSNTIELPPYMLHSFAEEKTKQLATSSESSDMIIASQNHFLRVYPKGTRFDSSNFDPMVAWSIGCQLAALNQQTSSEPMWLNNGLFSDNGGCGYILKPAYLLPNYSPDINGTQYNPNEAERATGSKYSRVIVQVISARQLPKYTKSTKGEVIDPYVTLSMCGTHFDQKVEKTKTIDNNGFNPHWGEEFEFPLYNSQLAMLLIRVDDKDKLGHNRIGHACIKVENIRSGYRVLKLKNNNNRTIPLASLLFKFTLLP